MVQQPDWMDAIVQLDDYRNLAAKHHAAILLLRGRVGCREAHTSFTRLRSNPNNELVTRHA